MASTVDVVALAGIPPAVDPDAILVIDDGRVLIHDPASTATVDNVTTFPAIVGRHIWPSDGVLSSQSFGLTDSTTLDQSAAMQSFLAALAEPSKTNYRGLLAPGTYDCAGATLEFRRYSGGFAQMNGWLEGASRRNSIISNVTLAVGSLPWETSTASVANMRNIRIQGYLDIWNCEGNSFFENVTVARPSDNTFDRTGYPSPTYDDYKGWMVTMTACNHPIFINLSVDGHTGFTDYKQGVWVVGTANPHFIQGTVFGSNPGVLLDTSTSYAKLDHLKFEQCEGINVYDTSFGNNIINVWARFGTNHSLSDPLIKIGNQGHSNPRSVSIRSRLFADLRGTPPAPIGTGLRLDACSSAFVDETYFEHLVTGIDINGVTNGAMNVKIGESNFFDGVTLPINRPATAKLARANPTMTAPQTLTSAATINWDIRYGKEAQVQITGACTLSAPLNLQTGERYRLVVSKTASSDTLAFDPIFVFSGSAPNFSAMTTSQHAVITIDCIVLGGSQILSCGYEVRG